MTKESNKKIKIIALILVIILILAAVGSFIGVIVFNKSNRKIQAIDFFEKAPINMVFDLEQTQNINNILEEKYVAVNNRAGFSAFSDNISLYEMYGIYKLADSINNNEIKDTLKNNIEDLKKIDITNLDMLNLYYYLFLCKEYNVSVNVNAIKSVLDKHYDNDMHLFNIFGENDLLANKIWISGNVLTVLSDLDYDIQNGLSKVFSTYQFKLPISGDTLYNSGGDIIYALNQNGLLDLIVRSNMNDWFEAWEEEYSDFSIKDDSTALIYSSFLDIVEIFAPDSLDSNDLMQKYFESLLVSQIPDSFDPNLWSTIMKYVKTPQNNMEIFNRILSSANEDISNLVISNKNIDVAETAFGIALANATGFEINKDYINNTFISYEKAAELKNQELKKTNLIAIEKMRYEIQQGMISSKSAKAIYRAKVDEDIFIRGEVPSYNTEIVEIAVSSTLFQYLCSTFEIDVTSLDAFEQLCDQDLGFVFNDLHKIKITGIFQSDNIDIIIDEAVINYLQSPLPNNISIYISDINKSTEITDFIKANGDGLFAISQYEHLRLNVSQNARFFQYALIVLGVLLAIMSFFMLHSLIRLTVNERIKEIKRIRCTAKMVKDM